MMRPERGFLAWLVPALVVAAAFSAFLPALHNQFVSWDDPYNLINNPNYRGLGWTQIKWMFTTFHLGHYQPLSWLTFAVDYRLWGMDPFGYHLTSLVLHAVNALIFYFVCLRLLRLATPGSGEGQEAVLRLGAGFGALLFAVHPLRVESVVWATERRDVLSGLFYLSTLLCYLKACAASGDGALERRWQWAGLAAFLLSLLSKAWGITLPVILLALDIYPLRRLPADPWSWSASGARRVLVEKIPYFLLALTVAAGALIAQRHTGAMETLRDHPIGGRLAQAVFGLAFYLWKTVVPVHLLPLYELRYVEPLTWPYLLSDASVLAVSAGLFWARKRCPAGLVVWACYIVTLSPVLGLAQSGMQAAADRYTYLSCLGWAVLGGAGFVQCWRAAGARWRKVFLPAAGVVVGVFALLTWRQTAIWHDSEGLWRYILSIDPGTSIGHYNFGVELSSRGEVAEAVKHYEEALRIRPSYAEAHLNLGEALSRQGRTAEALDHYREALRLKPDYPEAHNNLGAALFGAGRNTEAAAEYRKALEADPTFVIARKNLGLALQRLGATDEAIEHFREALRLKPDYADARTVLEMALSGRGRTGDAIEQLRETVRLDPSDAQARASLAGALADQGRDEEALAQYREALRLKPGDAVAHYNLALFFHRRGRVADAITEYKGALRIRPDDPDTHNNLGVALLAAGRAAEAVEQQRQALRANPNYPSAHYNMGLALQNLGKTSEAMDQYRQALRLKPDYAESEFGLGACLDALSRPAEALAHYRAALRINPGLSAARERLMRDQRPIAQ